MKELLKNKLGDIIYQQHFKSLHKDGKTNGGVAMNRYQKGKEKARNETIDWQAGFADHNYSYGGLACFSDYFETKAGRYGLVKEFKENGII